MGLQLPSHFKDTRWRLTVDETEDFQMMEKLYGALYKGQPIPLEVAMGYLHRHPELVALNQHVEHSNINQELAARRAAQQLHLVGTLSR